MISYAIDLIACWREHKKNATGLTVLLLILVFMKDLDRMMWCAQDY